ncbi:Zn-ribbon domain-containing OB-fold protein [Nocardia coffeae]|uniref:Zn-ribbon domain-containing OB-fold protein n=1 Tax=Nocardia coffeae TaxID=2873381 RepID=UPI0027DECD27|nr:OB-fold domain-containing protein [Nocardia coffeae]
MTEILLPQRGPLPCSRPTRVSAHFWAGIAAGELRYQICAGCASVNFPPVEICRECQIADLTWHVSAGHGTLYSWTVVHRPVTPAFAELPYAPAIVHLDEGFRTVTNLIGTAPGDITPDMRVQVAFHRVHGELHLPYFRPVTTKQTQK